MTDLIALAEWFDNYGNDERSDEWYRRQATALREAHATIERLSLADAEDVAEVERLKASERTAWNAAVVQAERHWAEVERLRALLNENRSVLTAVLADVDGPLESIVRQEIARIDAELGNRHD